MPLEHCQKTLLYAIKRLENSLKDFNFSNIIFDIIVYTLISDECGKGLHMFSNAVITNSKKFVETVDILVEFVK